MFSALILYTTFSFMLEIGIFLFFSKNLLKKTAIGCCIVMALTFLLSLPPILFPYMIGMLLLILFYFKTKNLFISCLISNLFFVITGMSFFLAFDLTDFLGSIHLTYASMLALSASLFFYLLLKSIDKRTRFLNLLFSYTQEHYFGSLCILSTWVLVFVLLGSVSFRSSSYLWLSVVSILSSFFSLVFSIMIVSLQLKTQQYRDSLKSYQMKKEYYRNLEEFKHDYKGLLLSVKSLLQENNEEEALGYLQTLEKYSEEVMQETEKQQIEKILIPAVRGSFYEFLESAKEENIPVKLFIPDEIRELSIDLILFIRCLSIFFTNALEHTIRDQTPVSVSFYKEASGIRFVLSNKTKTTDLALSELLKRGTTTKAQGGLGLYIAQKTLDACENAELSIDYSRESRSFSVDIFLIVEESS